MIPRHIRQEPPPTRHSGRQADKRDLARCDGLATLRDTVIGRSFISMANLHLTGPVGDPLRNFLARPLTYRGHRLTAVSPGSDVSSLHCDEIEEG
jgi:hypothetical protein